MRYHIYTLPVVGAFIFLLACQPNHSSSIESEEVTEVIDRWLDLWATYDLNRLEEIFWNDPNCSYFSSEREGLIKGYNALIPHHRGFGFISGGKTPGNTLWLEELDVLISTQTAVVSAIWYFGDKTQPKDSIQRGPVTFVLLKDKDQQVKIGHTHFANY